jgi:hypothetical protein
MRGALLGGDMERRSQVLFLEAAAVEEEVVVVVVVEEEVVVVEEEEEGVEDLRRWTSLMHLHRESTLQSHGSLVICSWIF